MRIRRPHKNMYTAPDFQRIGLFYIWIDHKLECVQSGLSYIIIGINLYMLFYFIVWFESRINIFVCFYIQFYNKYRLYMYIKFEWSLYIDPTKLNFYMTSNLKPSYKYIPYKNIWHCIYQRINRYLIMVIRYCFYNI